jgi:acyl-CoA synthetase (AMP-forming)/AMP-acid ligase II
MRFEDEPAIRSRRTVGISPAELQYRLCDVLASRSRRYSGRPACVVLDRNGRETTRMTYGELDRRARSVAVAIQREAAPGDRALLAFPSGADFLIALFACAYADVIAIPVPLPGESASSEGTRLASIIKDATPALLLTAAELAGGLDQYGMAALRSIAVSEVPTELADEFQDPGHGSDAIAFLQYTSGSTNDPKGVKISHHNAVGNLADSFAAIPISPLDGEPLRIVSWLPLFHDMGLSQALLPIFDGGIIVLIAPTSFLLRPLLWLEAIARYKAHMSTAPNFAYDLCARRVTEEQCRDLDLSGWQLALNGSEPVRAGTLELFARRFAAAGFDSVAFVPCYGLAEATFYVSGARGVSGHLTVSVPALERESLVRDPREDEEIRQVVSCGPVARELDLRIVDTSTHRECPPGRVGEIWISGISVAVDYWRRADERFGARLPDVPAGPFLRTGDLGFVRDGELYVLGRNDDVIVLDGRNYYPQDIELTAQQSHHALAEGRVAAFAYPRDETTAVAIVAETARRVRVSAEGAPVEPGQTDRSEVVRAVRAAVSAAHQIRVTQVILLRPAGLPRTTSGKVRRRRCRELFLTDKLKAW